VNHREHNYGILEDSEAEVLRIDADFSLERFAQRCPQKNQENTDCFAEALRKAGLKWGGVLNLNMPLSRDEVSTLEASPKSLIDVCIRQ
jgi:hypothetical protein